MKRRVYIRGKAVNCALGQAIEEVADCMRQGLVRVSDMPLSIIKMDYSRPYYRLPAQAQAEPEAVEHRFYDILYKVISHALSDAGLTREEIEQAAVFFGSTSIDIPIYEEQYKKARQVLSRTSSGYGNIAHAISARWGTRGPCYTFTTACTSSANGVLFATNMIAQGMIERAIVVGYDLFSNIGFCGFEAMKLIAPMPYRPFDKNRQGVIMGEGCGVIVLDTQAQSNDFYCMGGANACDTYSITTHDPQGGAIALVIQQALAQAGLSPDDIDAVKAHATGSYHNDLTECNAIKRVYQGCKLPPVTGLKPFVGHTVGACGVIELILFSEAVRRGFVPATLGFEAWDEELGIAPLTRPMPIQTGNFLLNYFGFGGNCVSLIISNKP